jgi:RNA polymerase sigma factor (sigma-70 family)
MKERPDWTDGIRRGDANVTDAVVRAALPGLLRAARAAGLTADQVDDVVQATVLVYLERAPAFDGRAKASTWMHGILVRKVMEQRRAERRAEPSDEIDVVFERQFDEHGSWVRAPDQPGAQLPGEEFRRRLAACLDELPRSQRDAFTLREADELPTEDVCKILQVTPNNLGVLLFRARMRLRRCLERHGFTGGADAEL